MNYEIAGVILALVMLWATWAVVTGRRQAAELGRLPPGPRRWPVVGNLLQLAGSASTPHQSLAKLAEQYGGDVMTLHLGSMTTVVLSSGAAARATLKQHDAALAGRTVYESMKGDIIDNDGSIITAQYGPRWRALRRLCRAELFAAGTLDSMRGTRAHCVDQMVQHVAAARGGGGIDVGWFFFLMAFNLIGNLIFSRDLLNPDSERGAEFFYHARKVTELAGKPNVADFFPGLKRVDPQGIRRRTQFHVKKAFDVAGEFLKERMREMENGSGLEEEKKKKDYLDVLLEYEGDDNAAAGGGFSSTVIHVIVLEMFTAGTDTTTSTLEWAMTELLHNPETLHKLQSELRTVIRPGQKLDEQRLENLPYLKAVIKETLRLHPPLPFLVPHKAVDSCNMLGFHIPKETQILVNVWAIGRDPKTWKDPSRFTPERFLGPDHAVADFKGHHFELIPFGSGRRMCPAVPLVSRVLPLALGSVLHAFDWVLADGIKAEEMDMRERMGITIRKDVPLKAIPIPHV